MKRKGSTPKASKAALERASAQRVDILHPDAVRALARELTDSAGIRVVIDWNPSAVPRTGADGVIYLPAFQDRAKIDERLVHLLHESAHAQYDRGFLRAVGRLRSRSHSAKGRVSLAAHVIFDVRNDRRRCAQFGGARSLYEKSILAVDRRLAEPEAADAFRNGITQSVMTCREDLRQEIVGVREELRQEIAGVREELRQGITGVRDELRAQTAATHALMHSLNAGTRTHMLVLHEEVLERIKRIGEGKPEQKGPPRRGH